jgi:ribosome-associated toxin RatA of RatAB toxin-antitoxin module
MLTKTLVVLVHAEHDTLWSMLLDRLQNPERFTPGITESRVIEKEGNTSVREMRLHGELVRERVTVRPHESEIEHVLLEHPRFTGIINTKVVRTARQSPVAPQHLEYHIQLTPVSRLVKGVVFGEAEIVSDLEAEMNRLKSRAEEMESATDTRGSNPPPA